MGKFVPSPRMNFPRTNQTNKYRGLMSNHEFISFWFYPEDIQATQQLKFTNEPGDKRKAESQLQMNCYLVEHCPENKTTQVCEELIKYEECPNYSYFIPSKL